MHLEVGHHNFGLQSSYSSHTHKETNNFSCETVWLLAVSKQKIKRVHPTAQWGQTVTVFKGLLN